MPVPEARIRQKLAAQIDRAEAELERLRALLTHFHANSVPEDTTGDSIRAVLKSRRRRDAVFGGGLFVDPAWDILLHVYAGQLDNAAVSVADVTKETALPATTVLRWVERLERLGLLRRSRDKSDARRRSIHLSPVGTAAMEQYFRQPEPSGPAT